MTLKNTLKNYFNSGSPDKRTKRRIGGLVIAITAVALVAALLVLTVSSIASAIANKKANAAGEGEPVSTAIETVSGDISAVNAKLNSLVTLVDGSGLVLTENDVKTFVSGKDGNRTPVGENSDGTPFYAYGCNSPSNDALISEAYAAFDKMACDFYNNAGNHKIFVFKAYRTDNNVAAAYANGLTVKLHTFDNFDNKYETSIYGDSRYDWVYENAAEYGFVRVSNEEGEEDVFRYVGVVHAKAIAAKSTSEKAYTISEYIEELKATSPEAPKKVSAKTFVYYVPFGESYALPNPEKYDFTASNVGDGYVITCFAK